MDSKLKEQIELQMGRLIQQLADLDEFRDDLEEDEYQETLDDTHIQLKEFQHALDKISDGSSDMTLIDTVARMKMAIQAAISDAFKTPEVIRMFANKDKGQLRVRLDTIDQALKLKKMTAAKHEQQKVEILSALKKLGVAVSPQEDAFLEANMTKAMSEFERATNSIGAGATKGILGMASAQADASRERAGSQTKAK